MSTETTTEVGVGYPDGSVDWTATASFGTLATPGDREAFQTQYTLRLKSMGVSVPPKLSFVCREKTVTYSDPKPVSDDENVDEPISTSEDTPA